MKIKLINLILVLIVGLSFFLRFYKVTQVPPSLNWDEVSIGYNAYSILKTGKDEWGKFLPIHFKSYGEYKLPGQIYASVPAIAIFGLNPFGIRITPVIYGTLTVLLMYFLGKELFKNKWVGILSAFFLSISPWHIQLTRASFESSFALMWVVLGVWFMVKGFSDKKWWVISTIPFSFAMYTYNSARAFVPLFLVANLIFYRKELLENKKFALISLAVFAVLMIPLAQFVLSGEGSARYKLVSVTDEAGLIPRIEERRNLSTLPEPLNKLVHNRVTYISATVVKNYIAHFSPDFLFISGAHHKQHHPQNIGELYWIQAPFLLYGFYLLLKRKNKFAPILNTWLFLALVPVAFTLDSIPHALRTLNAAPTYQFFTAFGVVEGYKLFSKKYSKTLLLAFWGILIFLLLYQFVNYQINFYNEYPLLYSRDWQYGNKEAVEFIQKNYDKYDLIVYTREYGEPHMFTLFYLNYPPYKFQNDPNLERFETYDWVRVLKFDKFYFPDLGDEGTMVGNIINANPGKKILFIGTPDEIPNDYPILENIYFLNGDKAFEIVEKI